MNHQPNDTPHARANLPAQDHDTPGAIPFDPRDFRRALSMFGTGVTIVTARAEDGTPVGMTANSFNSVSLDPPMVLWSLAKSARSLAVFHAAEHWNVHILANDQDSLSNRFARAGEDKFTGLPLDASHTAAPLLPGCSARFQCRTVFRYEGGDHIIFVGEVIGFDRSERAPLLYVSGAYALATQLSDSIATEPAAALTASPFTEELLGYLLGRAHYQFMWGFRRTLEAHGLSDYDFFVLSLLAVRAPLGADDIAAHTAYTGLPVSDALLASLCERDLLSVDPATATYALSERGRDVTLHVLAAAQSVEAGLLERLGPQRAAALRNLLKHLIAASDPGLPPLWTGAPGA
jgi:3-hydroxy-9,10-secoandrosta-1,3,5(10)-triene-9,17-dione monooxygenase reductase component